MRKICSTAKSKDQGIINKKKHFIKSEKSPSQSNNKEWMKQWLFNGLWTSAQYTFQDMSD